MKKLNFAGYKSLGALFFLLLLLLTTVLITQSVSDVREPVSRAASSSVNVVIFYDKDGDGYRDAGEAFASSGNQAFSSSIATVKEINSWTYANPGSWPNITSKLAPDGVEKRTITSTLSYAYKVTPSSGWKITKYAIWVGTAGTPGSCQSVGSFYTCPYRSGGTTHYFYVPNGSSTTLFLGVTVTTSPPPPPPDDDDTTPQPPPPPPPSRPPSNRPPPPSSSGTFSNDSITGIINSLNVKINPPSFLVGKSKATIKVGGSSVSKNVDLSAKTNSISIPVNGALPQGVSHKLTISGKDFVNESKTFKATNDKPTVSFGSLVFGDINNDEKVNKSDLSLFLEKAAKKDTAADITLDGKVNSLDYSVLLSGFLNKGKVEAVKEEANLSLFANTENAKLGDEFMVDVIMDTGSLSSDGADISLTYDPTILSLKNIEKTSLFSNYIQSQELTGYINITALAKKDEPLSGTNTVVSLVFEAITEGSTKIEFVLEEPFTADNNISGRFSGVDMLATADNLVLDISAEGISATNERVGAKSSSIWTKILQGIFFILVAAALVFLGLYIKKKWKKSKMPEIFMPEEVPLDRPPRS